MSGDEREGAPTLLSEADIREFLQTAYPRLAAAVALVSGSRPAAEDAVQEALARAWERSERGERIESLPAWVTRVAMNLSKSRLRTLRAERKARDRIADAASADGRVVANPSDDRIDIERALADLPRRQREATVLRYYLGMDVAEVAATLEVSVGTAKTTLFRARRKLAAALGEQDLQEANDLGTR